MKNIALFCGNASQEISKEISRTLDIPLGKIKIGKFSDGEISVEIMESVRGKDVFIIQSTCSPANDNLMELVIASDAFRRASAKSITAVVPYFGYARQDRRVKSRTPITSKIVVDIIEKSGIDRIVVVDLHAEQIQGFFSIPVDNIYASETLLSELNQDSENLSIVSPDFGGVSRAREIAKKFKKATVTIIEKTRPKANYAEIMNIIGDVQGKDCIIVDDIVDTAGTLCKTADHLKKHGAKTVFAYCTHPVLSGKALDNIGKSGLDKLIVSDSIPLPREAEGVEKIKKISISKLLSDVIKKIIENSCN